MTRKHIFPAGDYYIGDPCYLIPRKDWDGVIKSTNYFGEGSLPQPNFDDGVYSWNGKRCFASYTAHGDGIYTNPRKTLTIGVDSGTISIIPVDRADEPKTMTFFIYGNHVRFPKEFSVWEENGVFHFGKIKIDTN